MQSVSSTWKLLHWTGEILKLRQEVMDLTFTAQKNVFDMYKQTLEQSAQKDLISKPT